MANDSSLLPTPLTPPPSPATQSTTGPNPYNYSEHISRLITALDQISLSLAFIADKVDNISVKVSSLEEIAKIDPTEVKTVDPYATISVASMYAYYSKNPTETSKLLDDLRSIPPEVIENFSNLANIVKDLPKLP